MKQILAVLLLGVVGCSAFEEPIAAGVLTAGPREITSAPGTVITFDDIEPVGPRYRAVLGTTDALHRPSTTCCAYGRCLGSRSPAVIDLEAAFDAIEEYRRLRTSAHPTDSADYILMLARVNDRFAAALGQYIQDSRLYDTVFATGSVRLREGTKAPGLPDITFEVIRRLK